MSEYREVVYDEQLQIEAYQFRGIMQKFPNHFHEHYVIGFIEKGKRKLSCRNREYEINPGDLMLFEPGMNHTCEQIDGQTLDYRCLNIKKDIMLTTMQEITQRTDVKLPEFPEAVIFRAEQVESLRLLHQLIMNKSMDMEKEEIFYFLMQELVWNYADTPSHTESNEDQRLIRICDYIEAHYMENITLDMLHEICGMNKYVMLRNFAAKKGITPYQYLLATRINYAMKLLEEGTDPLEAAMQTGFADQSHFSNAFKRMIGITPGQYKMIREQRNEGK